MLFGLHKYAINTHTNLFILVCYNLSMHYEILGFMPDWFIDNVFIWYLENKISHDTLVTAGQWLLDNILN